MSTRKSKGNIHRFPGCKLPKRRAREQPREEVIAVIEEFLELAQNGELQSVAIAGVMADDNTYRNHNLGVTAPVPNLLGALSLLMKEIADAAEEEALEEEPDEEIGE